MSPQYTTNEGTHMMVNNIDEENLLLDHLKADMRVLEFGSGYSTILIASRVRQVISIEHDINAYNSFAGKMPPNVAVIYIPQNAPIAEIGGDGTFDEFKDYVQAPMQFCQSEKFDLVFIDGRARVDCAKFSERFYLKDGGLIFIHDYKHPQPPPYRRLEYEVVETFLKMEKHVFAMAMFTVIPEDQRSRSNPVITIAEPVVIKAKVEPNAIEQARAEFEQHMIDQVTQMQIDELKKQETPPMAADEKPTTTPEPADEPKQNFFPIPFTNDSGIRWSKESVDGMNSFFDKHAKDPGMTKHMEQFTKLLNCVIADVYHDLLDLGCGTAMVSEWTKDFEYHGADLPHIITGCAIRNYPNHFYRGCDIIADDLSWIARFDVITMNAVIDIMEHPLYVLDKVLQHTKKYLLVHRQEISESRPTHSDPNGPGYGGHAWHSVLNRNDFEELVVKHKFRKVAEVPCSFANWENGGSSFLLEKLK